LTHEHILTHLLLIAIHSITAEFLFTVHTGIIKMNRSLNQNRFKTKQKLTRKPCYRRESARCRCNFWSI